MPSPYPTNPTMQLCFSRSDPDLFQLCFSRSDPDLFSVFILSSAERLADHRRPALRGVRCIRVMAGAKRRTARECVIREPMARREASAPSLRMTGGGTAARSGAVLSVRVHPSGSAPIPLPTCRTAQDSDRSTRPLVDTPPRAPVLSASSGFSESRNTSRHRSRSDSTACSSWAGGRAAPA
mgnify:FL=1